MARRMSVEIVGDEASVLRSFRRASAGASRFNRDVERGARGAVAASLSFHGLGRAVAFGSAQFLGGAGLVYGLKSTISAAMESQRVIANTEVAVRRSGNSWHKFGGQIQNAALSLSNKSGFDDERLLGTFSNLVRRTGDVNRALTLNALAADVARGRNISLEQAQQLVLKASLGMAGQLRRVGIEAKNGSTGLELIDMLQRKFAGSADAYGKTAQGAFDRFGVALQNTQETIGATVLPGITRLLNRGSAWMFQSRNQAIIQRDVKRAVQLTSSAFHALEDITRVASGVFRRLSNAVGGNKHAFELLIGLWAGFKAAKLIASLSQVATAFWGVAAAETAAGTAGGGVPGVGGKLGKFGKFGKAALRLAPAAAAGAALAYGQKDESNNDQPPGTVKLPNGLYADPKTGNYAYRIAGQTYQGPKVPDGLLPRGRFGGVTSGRGMHGALLTNRHELPVTATAAAASASHRGPTLGGRFNLAEYAMAKAALTATQADDRRILVTEAAITQQQIKQAKTLADKTKLTNQLADISGRIRGIDQDAADKAKQAAADRKQRLKDAREKASQFSVPLKLQVAEAKAAALAPAGGETMTKNQVSVAKAIRAAALKAIRSHRLSLQGLIDAWNTVGQVNQSLQGQAKRGRANSYHHAATSALTKGLGLTHDQSVALRMRQAQLDAHRGYVPNGPAALGQPVTITGGVHLHGVRNVDQLYSQLEKVGKRRGQRRGSR